MTQDGGLYIHVPFCLSKCLYCDFFSITDHCQISPYLDALKTEMDLSQGRWGAFDTVYLGGGTPSLLSPRQVQEVLDHAHKRFSINSGVEITLEANPATVSPESLKAYKSMGIGRLNLGVQSFQDVHLKFLGRAHGAGDAERALRQARDAGFEDVGYDLIFGIPGQTEKQWQSDLERVTDFWPEHLSCYMLSFEKGTPLGEMRDRGQCAPPDEEAVAALFLYTDAFLSSRGYAHYEVSNFSKGEDRRSRHNSKYWNGAPYLGLGPSAHSYSGKERSWNVRSVQDYVDLLKAGQLPQAGKETLSREQRRLEALYLALRQAKGIVVREFERLWGLDFDKIFGKTIHKIAEQGLMTADCERCALTARGMLYLDAVAALLGNCL